MSTKGDAELLTTPARDGAVRLFPAWILQWTWTRVCGLIRTKYEEMKIT